VQPAGIWLAVLLPLFLLKHCFFAFYDWVVLDSKFPVDFASCPIDVISHRFGRFLLQDWHRRQVAIGELTYPHSAHMGIEPRFLESFRSTRCCEEFEVTHILRREVDSDTTFHGTSRRTVDSNLKLCK
jgi:hypothetical protein